MYVTLNYLWRDLPSKYVVLSTYSEPGLLGRNAAHVIELVSN